MAASPLSAGAWLALGTGKRLLRESLVVRALLWPASVCALAIVGTAGAYAVWGTTPRVVVDDPALVAPLADAGLDARLIDGPERQLRSGREVRALWWEGDTLVFGRSWPGRGSLRIEAAARDLVQAPWRVRVPPVEARPTDVDRQAGLMAGLVGVLFALYGVVMGAGSLFRDRESGTLESELALPVPKWLHPAARLTALATLLFAALAASLLVLHAILPIGDVAGFIVHGGVAAAAGATIGFDFMARARPERGFSAPLTRALTVVMMLMGAGWMRPDLAGWMPVASLGAALSDSPQSALAAAMLVPLVAAESAVFARRSQL